MKVFISWSGDRSRKLAEFLAGWLRKLPLTIVPWVSKEAIDPGTRWGKELAEALEGTSFGILCLTNENQKGPWINFEAGALSKTIEKTYVVPYLIGMTPLELEQPLKQFQACEADNEGTWRLIETIHMASGDTTRTIADLKEAFNMWWAKLNDQIQSISRELKKTAPNIKEPSIPDIKSSIDNVQILLESLSSRITTIEKNVISKVKKELVFLGAVLAQGKKATGFTDDRDYINYLENLGYFNMIEVLEEPIKQSQKGSVKREEDGKKS